MKDIVKLNFFGDFVGADVNNLNIGNKLKKIISNSDLNILNFEAPVKSDSKPISKSGPNNYQSCKAPEWIENNGFNIITLSNNHLMDFGDIGYNNTINSFKKSKLLGAGSWNEAYQPLILEIKGYKIGFISLTQFEFGTLTDSFDKETIGCAWINHPFVDAIITRTRKEVNFLIILPHAGLECIEQPLPEWRERYRSFIELGCDAVIASHPHIPQGWELYQDRPIFYSLGNFYFPKKTEKPWYWYRSLCVSINIENNKLSYDVHSIIYDSISIDIQEDTIIKNYINHIQKVLQDHNTYITEINKVCQDLLPQYNNLFYWGGLLEMKLNMKFFKRIIKFIIKRNPFIKEHLINNLRCESHRWSISRALKNKYNIR